MLYALIGLSVALPVMTIAAFIVGYNVNANRKLFVKPKERPLTEDEKLLKRIDALTMEDF